jgi:hypothetical protein
MIKGLFQITYIKNRKLKLNDIPEAKIIEIIPLKQNKKYNYISKQIL